MKKTFIFMMMFCLAATLSFAGTVAPVVNSTKTVDQTTSTDNTKTEKKVKKAKKHHKKEKKDATTSATTNSTK
jgi:uncharacterized membrane protein YgcG